jgi:3-oxoacyl-[acyl-carrier protein] reductase
MRLNQVQAIVTGAASGMGKEFTLSLLQAGASVTGCDLDLTGLEALQVAAQDLPGSLSVTRVDVSDEDSVIAMVETASSAMGGLNVLINNAGIFRDGLLVKQDRQTGEIKKMSLSKWNSVIAVDLTGPFLCTREFAAKVIASATKDAVVVNISSVARHGNRGQTNYSAAKAGLVADTKLWGEELARYGIRTGAIAPGFVDTPILQGMRPEVLEDMLKAVPLRRPARTEEIFAAVRFIIECGYFTGRCIDVDGGMRV